MRKSIYRIMALLFVAATLSVSLSSCDDDDDYYGYLDRYLIGTWIESTASYDAGYITFYSDGTGEHGYYDGGLFDGEMSFDWYNDDDGNLYINGTPYWYSIAGPNLTISGPDGTWYYYAYD